MVHKRGVGGGNSEEGKRPKINESDEDDSQTPAINDADLMRSLEVSDHASFEYRAPVLYEYESSTNQVRHTRYLVCHNMILRVQLQSQAQTAERLLLGANPAP